MYLFIHRFFDLVFWYALMWPISDQEGAYTLGLLPAELWGCL